MGCGAPEFDVLGLGAVAVDDLLYVPHYPPADEKVAVTRRERQGGGLTGTALVAAARLGSKCAYAGALGNDPLSRYSRENLASEGIDVGHVVTLDPAPPFHSIVIVDTGRNTRNIFYDESGVIGADPDLPAEDVIRSTRVLFVDHVGIVGMVRAIGIARKAGIPVVADCERHRLPGLGEFLALPDHLIVSLGFASQVTGGNQAEECARSLWNGRREIVVVTDGASGSWYIDRADPSRVRHQPAFPVVTVDTTGCGDVFHGAYASALARNVEAGDRIRFAAAAAALKATRPGGQKGIPDRLTVEAFLKERS